MNTSWYSLGGRNGIYGRSYLDSFIETKYQFPYFNESKIYFYKISLNHSRRIRKENQGNSWNLVVDLNFVPKSEGQEGKGNLGEDPLAPLLVPEERIVPWVKRRRTSAPWSGGWDKVGSGRNLSPITKSPSVSPESKTGSPRKGLVATNIKKFS